MNKPGDLRARLARAEEEARLTRAKFELLEIASTDERLKPGEFRFLSRLLKHLDKKSWTARVSDERMIAEVPKCGDSSVCNSHRKALAAAGWFAYEPGTGKRATVYRFPKRPPNPAIRGLEARQSSLADRRGEKKFGPGNTAPGVGGEPTLGWAANHLRNGPRTNPGVGGEPGIPCVSSLYSSQDDPSDSIPDPELCSECEGQAVAVDEFGWPYCRRCADRYGLSYGRQDDGAESEGDV